MSTPVKIGVPRIVKRVVTSLQVRIEFEPQKPPDDVWEVKCDERGNASAYRTAETPFDGFRGFFLRHDTPVPSEDPNTPDVVLEAMRRLRKERGLL